MRLRKKDAPPEGVGNKLKARTVRTKDDDNTAAIQAGRRRGITSSRRCEQAFAWLRGHEVLAEGDAKAAPLDSSKAKPKTRSF